MKNIAFSLGILLLACLIVSPLVHEAVHVLVLDTLPGSYRLSLSALPSLHASAKILSPLGYYDYVLLLSSGVLASLALGAAFILRGRKKSCHLSSMCGVGFLLNPAIAMFSQNDFSTLLAFYNLSCLSVFIGLGMAAVCLYEMNFVSKILMGE
jgi:hypothetical protein